MLERNFCTILTHSFNYQDSFLWKIGDTDRRLKPFDCIGSYHGLPVAIEAKWLTSPKCFPLTRLEDHQIENLLRFYETNEGKCFSALVIGVDFGRNDKRIFSFSNEELYTIDKRKKERKNIFKKEFEVLPFIPLKNRLISLPDLIHY